jgi:hypothetical protein
VRRRARSIEGRVYYRDGTVEDIDRRWATASDEKALLLTALSIFAGGLAVLIAG